MGKERSDKLILIRKGRDLIIKFNPYHGYHGYFSSRDAHTDFSPGSGRTRAFSIARENIRRIEEGNTELVVGDYSITLKGGKATYADAKAQAIANGKWGLEQPGGKYPKEKQPNEKTEYPMQNEKQSGHSSVNYWREFHDEDKVCEQVASDLKISKKQATDMAMSVTYYSGSDFSDIRKACRGEETSEKYVKEANNIEEFIKASPKWAGGTLFRGMKFKNDDAVDEVVGKAMRNEPLDLRGISSWSTDKYTADMFSSYSPANQRVVFVTNGGSTNKGTSISHLSQFEHEQEVIVSGEASFMPTNVKTKTSGGKTTVYIYGEIQ